MWDTQPWLLANPTCLDSMWMLLQRARYQHEEAVMWKFSREWVYRLGVLLPPHPLFCFGVPIDRELYQPGDPLFILITRDY